MSRALIAWLSSLTTEALDAARTVLSSKAVRTAIMFIWPWAGVIVGMDLAAHYGDATGAALPVQLFISQDHSFGEYLEYSLTLSCAGMLFVMWRRLGAAAYLANAVMMVWLTIDNAAEFHEAFGHWIAPYIPDPANSPVHANDIGEMLFFARCLLLDITIPVTPVAHQFRMRDLHDAANQLIQEFAIVRDHQYRAGITF